MGVGDGVASVTPVCTDEASHVGSRSDDYVSAFL